MLRFWASSNKRSRKRFRRASKEEFFQQGGNSPMRFLKQLIFLGVVSGMALAQTGSAGSVQGQNSSLADELKALREAVTAQQAQIAQQQQQMAQQQQQIEKLQQSLTASGGAGTAHVENAALHTNAPAPTATVARDAPPQDKPKESPLSFRIGQADFTPGGFVDFETVF